MTKQLLVQNDPHGFKSSNSIEQETSTLEEIGLSTYARIDKRQKDGDLRKSLSRECSQIHTNLPA